VLIVGPEPETFTQGIELYRNRPDKNWSLTDCISFVVMKREGITEALTGDRHFEQAGFFLSGSWRLVFYLSEEPMNSTKRRW
jgi:predicted nucleic acid-binding protein